MSQLVDRDPKLAIIVKALLEVPGIDAVYLFGSRARGHHSTRRDYESDYDLGILVNPDHKVSILALQTRLVVAGIDNCDVVIVDPQNVVLTHEIVKHHKLLFSSPAFSPEEFYLKVKKLYFDLQPVLQRQREALKRKLSNGRQTTN